MRQIPHLVLAALVVAASVAAVPAAGASTIAHDAPDVHATGVDTYDQFRDDADDQPDDPIAVTDFAVDDRTLEPGESLAFTAELDANADASAREDLVVSVDGERQTIGTLAVGNGDAEFLAQDDDWGCEVEVHVDEDGITITIRCGWGVAGAELSPGTHRIGLNGHDPVAVEVRESADDDGSGDAAGGAPADGVEDPADDRRPVETVRVDDGTPCVTITISVGDVEITYRFGCDGAVVSVTPRIGGEDGVSSDGSHSAERSTSPWPWPCIPGPGPTFPDGPGTPCPFPLDETVDDPA